MTTQNKTNVKRIKEILEFNQHIFPEKTKIKWKTKDGKIVTMYGRKGVAYYKEKDVKKIIKLLKAQK